MGKLRVGERLSLADGSFATVTGINFELSPRSTGRWKPPSTGSVQAGQPCIGTFGTRADPHTGLFVVYNLIVAEWHTYFAAGYSEPVLVHNGGPCVKPYEVGKYGDMAKRSAGDNLDIDHITSHASNVARRELELRRSLSDSEKLALKNGGVSVAVPKELHALSPTWRGRNTAAQIAADAMDPGAARARDVGAMIRNARPEHKNLATVAGLKILRCGN